MTLAFVLAAEAGVLDPSLAVVLVTTAGALFMFGIGLVKDKSSGAVTRRLEKEIAAHRHYEAELLAWGTKSTEDPPRIPPDPPRILEEDG